MTSNEIAVVMRQALEALEIAADGGGVNFYEYAKDLRQAIATEESSATQEPVACVACEGNPKQPNNPCAVCGAHLKATQEPVGIVGQVNTVLFNELPVGTHLYTHPQPKAEQEPKRELTDAEIYKVIDQTENAVGYAHNAWDMADQIELVRAILKAAHGIKDNA